MKKITQILTAVLVFLIASCTGGNESVVGGATFTDYIPSILMVIGSAGMVFAGYKYTTGKKLGDISNEGQSLISTAKIIAVISALIFGMGLWAYLD